MRVSTLLAMLLWMCHASAQEFGTQWVCHPAADDTSQIWFRKTFVTLQRPARAAVTIASTGRFQLFVNERNVSGDVLLPTTERIPQTLHEKAGGARGISNRPPHNGNKPADDINRPTAGQLTIDVTRYLRPDSNVIAVWYAPVAGFHSDKQLSLTYYGTMPRGASFCHQADVSWDCKKAGAASTPAGGEQISAADYDKRWKAATLSLRGWVRPTPSSDHTRLALTDLTTAAYTYRIVSLLSPVRITSTDQGLQYDFGRAFDGWVRLTIRDARKGQCLQMGGLTYICSGEMDEQMCRKFTIARQKEVTVTGDKHFKPEQIQAVEGLEIAPQRAFGFSF